MPVVLILCDDSSLRNHIAQIVGRDDAVRIELAELQSDVIKTIDLLHPDMIIIALDKKLKPARITILEEYLSGIPSIVISTKPKTEAYDFAKGINSNNLLIGPIVDDSLRYAITYILKNSNNKVWKITDARNTHFLDTELIQWIKVEGNYCTIQHQDKLITIRKPLKQIEIELKSTSLIKVHRSALINPSFISEVRISDSKLIMKGGETLPIGRTYRKTLYPYK